MSLLLSTAVLLTCLSGINTSYYVYTPRGTAINVLIRGEELSTYAKTNSIMLMEYSYPNASLISEPTTNYNCHSYAWHLQSANNIYWTNDPCGYYTDGSYTEISSPLVNDIVCYYDSNNDVIHSGIIISIANGLSNNLINNLNFLTIRSKWGQDGLYEKK